MNSRWPTILATIIVFCGVVVITGAAFVYSGVYDVGAMAAHWPVTHRIITTMRDRSIQTHAVGIRAPSGLDNEATIVEGVSHFAEHCAVCHGAPGVPRDELATGLYPRPPDLSQATSHFADNELFWILKHGIKATGMPSWAGHTDDELWATVALLKKLPAVGPEEYARLVKLAQRTGGQHHSDTGKDEEHSSHHH